MLEELTRAGHRLEIGDSYVIASRRHPVKFVQMYPSLAKAYQELEPVSGNKKAAVGAAASQAPDGKRGGTV
jgi:hypothetical protein